MSTCKNTGINNYFQTHYWPYGKREGNKKYWYDNGQLQLHSFWRNDKREGSRKVWYKTGILLEQDFWRDGKREGERKVWRSDGQILEHSFWSNDKRNGECKTWKWIRDLQVFEFEYTYWNNNVIVDTNFSIWKKHIWLKFKRNLYRKTCNHVYKPFLMDNLFKDLKNIVIEYM